MPEDQPRPEDQRVTPDTLMEVAPGVLKPLKVCTDEEVLMAALLGRGQVEWEMQEEVRRLTTDPDEQTGEK